MAFDQANSSKQDTLAGGGQSANGTGAPTNLDAQAGQYDFNTARNRLNTALGWNVSDADVNEAFQKFGGNQSSQFSDQTMLPIYQYFQGRGQGDQGTPQNTKDTNPGITITSPTGPTPPPQSPTQPTPTTIPNYQMKTKAPDLTGAFKAGESGGILSDPTKVGNDLYSQLSQRAGQSLNIDPMTDAVIRPQVDAAAAQFTRQGRNLIDDQAESGSPYATGTLQHSRTQAAENAGQQTSQLQSQLVQNELMSRRSEIQNALSQQGSMLTADQQLSLQRQMADVNAQLQKYQLEGGFELGGQQMQNNLGLGLLNAGMQQQGINNQNSQFYSGLSQQDQQFLNNLALQYQGMNNQNSQFGANYNLNATNQASYWDSLRRGLLG